MYVFVIALWASWTVISAKELDWKLGCPVTKCPFPEEYATNLPHENDCTKFYKCFLGKPILQDCPLMIKGDPKKRLHYNRRLQVCDWPWEAGCESCPKVDKNDECVPPPKISNPEDDCDTYYECEDGEGKLRRCKDDDTCFSRTCQKCVPNRKGGEGCDEPDEPVECSENGQRKPHNCDCGLYWECQNYKWEKQWCIGGCHFNPKTKECEEPDKAGCMKLEE